MSTYFHRSDWEGGPVFQAAHPYVIGSAIPASGTHGPSVLLNDFQAGDENEDFRMFMQTPPTTGVLQVDFKGTGDFAPASDGVEVFVYDLYFNGANLGAAVASFQTGPQAGFQSAWAYRMNTLL